MHGQSRSIYGDPAGLDGDRGPQSRYVGRALRRITANGLDTSRTAQRPAVLPASVAVGAPSLATAPFAPSLTPKASGFPLPTYLNRWAGGRRTAPPAAASQSRAGLIDQSKSLKSRREIPAGFTTQGANL
jgi:hypothetical protein